MNARREAPSIALRDVRVTYGGRVVLDVDRFDLPAGETFAVLGTSGAGKSTLLRVAGLLERPDEGRVLVDGREAYPGDRAVRRRMAAVFQQPCLFTGTVCAYAESARPSAPNASRACSSGSVSPVAAATRR